MIQKNQSLFNVELKQHKIWNTTKKTKEKGTKKNAHDEKRILKEFANIKPTAPADRISRTFSTI